MIPVVHKELIGLFGHGLDVWVWEAHAVEAAIQLLYPLVGHADDPAKQEYLPVEW